MATQGRKICFASAQIIILLSRSIIVLEFSLNFFLKTLQSLDTLVVIIHFQPVNLQLQELLCFNNLQSLMFMLWKLLLANTLSMKPTK